MDFDEAKALLNDAFRFELRDHAFGDCEITWIDARGQEIADGISGSGVCSITFNVGGVYTSFSGTKARELKGCGTLSKVERNDEVGPDEYVEGQVMHGLTHEGVLEELTRVPKE